MRARNTLHTELHTCLNTHNTRRVLSRLEHPRIVRFLGACLASPHICILEELAEVRCCQHYQYHTVLYNYSM